MDTSVLIGLERGASIDLGDETMAIAAVTAAELLHGLYRSDSSPRRERRRLFLDELLKQVLVLGYSLDIARVHAQIWAELQGLGQTIGPYDLLIAATALHHGLPVATLNTREFARVPGLELAVF